MPGHMFAVERQRQGCYCFPSNIQPRQHGTKMKTAWHDQAHNIALPLAAVPARTGNAPPPWSHQKPADQARKKLSELRAEEAALNGLLAKLDRREDVWDWALGVLKGTPPVNLCADHSLSPFHVDVLAADMTADAEVLPKMSEDPKRVISLLSASRKFSFCSAEWGASSLNKLSSFADEMAECGVFRLPYDTSWFEFCIPNDETAPILAGVLAHDDGDGVISGYGFLFSRKFGAWAIASQIPNMLAPQKMTEWDDMFRRSTLAMVVAMSSKSARITADKVSPDREKGGDGGSPSSCERNIVTIHASKNSWRGAGNGKHRSPVMHWRRGHLRHYSSGLIVPIAPVLVMAGDGCVIERDYRIIGAVRGEE